MAFSSDAWAAIAGVRAAIDHHPFLTGLADGTLDRGLFLGYLAQDAYYLAEYARVLAACATQATDATEVAFWAQAAHNAVAVERALHESHLTGTPPVEPSPTALAYTSYLTALSARGAYPVLVAGLLPCFWIYDEVGRRLKEQVGDLTAHPYGDWIATYGDPTFTAVTDQVVQTTDRLAADAGHDQRQRMLTAFTTASRYEWMFWDAAWRRERWPV